MDNQLSLGIDESGGAKEAWGKALLLAEPQLGREALESWLRDAAPLSMEAGRLVLGVPNATARAWIERKYGSALADSLRQVTGSITALEVVVRKSEAPAAGKARSKAPESPVAARPAVTGLFAPLPLNEKYTFENFIVGPSNRFAQAAAAAVAESPGKGYNPLFVYGGVGLGKTHLLQAIGHELLKRNPRARIAYVSGETFTTHFITSLRERREEEFRRAYRSVDIWLLDDIQFIADKTSTKEEFFHTFNELYLTNRQIVLAADRPPRELRLLEDRLRTRLEAGLMAEITAPELETRMAILQRRAELEGAEVPDDVLYYIARAVTDNVRVLEAALIRLLALASLNRCGLSAELAARAVGAFIQEQKAACVSLVAVLRAVCEQFQVTEEELVGPGRERRLSTARQAAMYLLRELGRRPLAEIGEVFGGKTHSTVLYACSRLEQALKDDPAVAAAVAGLRARLTAQA
jgi:chromosomal replication initiator protein